MTSPSECFMGSNRDYICVALYNFKSQHTETVDLRKGERVLLLDDAGACDSESHSKASNSSNWCLVQNICGELGFAPRSYIEVTKVPVDEKLDFVEGCIEVIHIQATDGGKYTSQQLQCLKKLVAMRSDILIEKSNIPKDKSTKRRAPPPPIRKSSSQDVVHKTKIESEDSNKTSSMSDCVPLYESPVQPSERDTSINSSIHQGTHKHVGSSSENSFHIRPVAHVPNSITDNDYCQQEPIPENLGLQLIELIRTETNASHPICVSTVIKIMSLMSSALPKLSNVFQKISESTSNLETTTAQKLESEDGQKMLSLLHRLEDLKNEGHAINWNINNEEGIIIKHIKDLIELMMVADPKVCKIVLEHDGFNILVCLVTYYRMEHKSKIREQLVELFKCFCFIDSRCISILVMSVLPLELSREISANTDDGEKLSKLGHLFMLLFSTGECIPINHYEYIDINFIKQLLDLIDKFDDSESPAADVLVSIILAFNLHFKEDGRNIVMEALINQQVAKSFTEKIMLLINREDDPVSDEAEPEINTVIKLILDMSSSSVTCQLFYTNDIKVLIDIVLRQVSDLSSEDSMRNTYLKLLQKIITNSEYLDHLHRLSDIQNVLARIDKEEEFNESDQLLCRQMKDLLKNMLDGAN